MRVWVLLAGLNGMIAVGMGAYGAHGLAGDVFMQALAERASHYQLVHALALLAADRLTVDGLAAGGRRLAHGAAALFAIGIVLFCGSLYYKAVSGGPLPVPMLTPAGGIAFMAGWLALAVAGLRRTK